MVSPALIANRLRCFPFGSLHDRLSLYLKPQKQLNFTAASGGPDIYSNPVSKTSDVNRALPEKPRANPGRSKAFVCLAKNQLLEELEVPQRF